MGVKDGPAIGSGSRSKLRVKGAHATRVGDGGKVACHRMVVQLERGKNRASWLLVVYYFSSLLMTIMSL